jgi:hypothetical protein
MSTFRNYKPFDNSRICNPIIAFTLVSIIISTIMLFPIAFSAYGATDFVLRTSEQVYVPEQTLTIYGAAAPNEVLAVRIYDPSGLAVRVESVKVNEDGFFRQNILVWPEPSRNLPFGTYTIEAVSSVGNKPPQRVQISFAEAVAVEGTVTQFPQTHLLDVKLDAPSEVTIKTPFRIFVQITFDGALVDANGEIAVAELLGSSHIHSDNSTIVLNDKFVKLHPGLYYADVELESAGAYIIHAAAFHKGFLSHDSRVVTASLSSIGTIQESVNRLNQEISQLQATLEETRSALNDTKSSITSSVDEARQSIREDIGQVSDASGQINSIILPVLALIGVIIALQISLFARIRASYR